MTNKTSKSVVKRGRPRKTLLERFLAFVDFSEFHWIWKGGTGTHGYGGIVVEIDGLKNCFLAHRVSYWLFRGDIPAGMQIHHLCGHRNCVHPFHLQVATNNENQKKSDFAIASKESRKTHCVNGHEFSISNTKLSKRGRDCRECMLSRAKRRGKEVSAAIKMMRENPNFENHSHEHASKK